MIYAVTALIFGLPNLFMLTTAGDRFLVILATSLLVVTRYVSYIELAGFALLEPQRIRAAAGRISFSLGLIVAVLLANAAFFLYRFGLRDISVTAVSGGCVITAGVLISHMIASRKRGMSRSLLMRMVSGVLIVLGSADICITRYYMISPLVGLLTLFFGIYTERKSLKLALKQTLAAAGAAAGCGISVYYLRWYLDPALLERTAISPPVAISLGLTLGILGMGYYIYARRTYAAEPAGRAWEQGRTRR
jgi:hypothetical protein